MIRCLCWGLVCDCCYWFCFVWLFDLNVSFLAVGGGVGGGLFCGVLLALLFVVRVDLHA